MDWTPRGLWCIRKVQRLQTHGQPDGQPTSAAPSSSRLQLATNSKATDIIFWACRCGSWGSCGPQRCTYKVRTCICVMSGLIPDMQVVQMKPVRLNRLIQLTSSSGPFWRITPPVDSQQIQQGDSEPPDLPTACACLCSVLLLIYLTCNHNSKSPTQQKQLILITGEHAGVAHYTPRPVRVRLGYGSQSSVTLRRFWIRIEDIRLYTYE